MKGRINAKGEVIRTVSEERSVPGMGGSGQMAVNQCRFGAARVSHD